MNRHLAQKLQHLYLKDDPLGAMIVRLVDEALDDDQRERNEAAIEALENANVDQVFNEADSEHFDELLDDLAEQLDGSTEHTLYKAFVELQTELLQRATNAANHVEAAIKILEGRQ